MVFMKKNLIHILPRLAVTGLILAVTIMTPHASAVTAVVVSPDNMNGWWFFEEVPTASGTFLLGPSTPPLGNGSAQLTVNGTGRELFGTFAFAGTRLDAITSLGYNTYRQSPSSSSAFAPSLQLDIDTNVTDANTAWQGRLVYEPYYTHPVTNGVWQTWNPLDNAGTGNWWFSGAPGNAVCPINNPCTWTELLTAFPNAGIRSAGTNTGATQFKAGGPWTNGFVGNVDAFSIGVSGVVTTYDFELLPTPAALHVVKLVVNGTGGVALDSSFSVHVTGDGVDVAGSPAPGSPAPGTLYSLPPGTYVVSEDTNTDYNVTFSGACDSNGSVTLATGEDKICTIINTNIPPPPPVVVVPEPAAPVNYGGGGGGVVNIRVGPAIGILKVPTPLALPTGSGPVVYDYTVWNAGGQQALTGVVVTDNACSPVTLISGDVNEDSKLDPGENWKYSCATTLLKTTTNTSIVAGFSDDAAHQLAVAAVTATVVVGSPVSPPLITIVTVPSPLATLPFGGGEVLYTHAVTNPGVVALHDVVVTDDACAPVSVPTGDTNADNLLDPGETWTYSCRANVPVSVRNIATAEARANGFIVLGYSFTTVQVFVPALPNTGSVPVPPAPSLGERITKSQAVGMFRRSLSIGARGADVVALQTFLEQKGFLKMPRGVAKGYFGVLTRIAVGKYQKSIGVSAVGIFGKLTTAKLMLELVE